MRTKGEFLHYDPIKGMNKITAQEMANKMKKIEKTHFTDKVREIECPRQNNSYDCGVYTILMINKIIEKLRMKENIENITIEPREADEFRTQLRKEIMEPRRTNNQEVKKTKRKLHKNYLYFKELKERISKYPKLEEIEVEINKISKIIRKEEVYKMTELLLKKPIEKEVEKDGEKKKEKNKKEETPRRITRNMTKQLEEEKVKNKNKNEEEERRIKTSKKIQEKKKENKENKKEEEDDIEYRKP